MTDERKRWVVFWDIFEWLIFFQPKKTKFFISRVSWLWLSSIHEHCVEASRKLSMMQSELWRAYSSIVPTWSQNEFKVGFLATRLITTSVEMHHCTGDVLNHLHRCDGFLYSNNGFSSSEKPARHTDWLGFINHCKCFTLRVGQNIPHVRLLGRGQL